MNSYFDNFRKTGSRDSFFIGANTPVGFISYTDDIICEDSFTKIFIIKGGPGSGKSTLMRKLAGNFSENITYLYCSSDPDSLDGVIIKGNGGAAAVIDGTAPHTYDPLYPGACGEIVDLGGSFDKKKLFDRKEEIVKLVSEKKEHFGKAYKYLSAAEEIARARQALIQRAYLVEKAEKAASALAGKQSGDKKGRVYMRETIAFSCKGTVRMPGFESAKRKILISDYSCMLTLFAKTLVKTLITAGLDVWVSPFPLFGVCEIYLPAKDTLISPFCREKFDKIINLRRFADTKVLRQVRGKLNFTGKCYGMAINCALDELADAGRAHSTLEEIYTPAVDFSRVDEIYEKLLTEINEVI